MAVRLSSVFLCIQLSGEKKEAIVVAESTYLLLHNEIGTKDLQGTSKRQYIYLPNYVVSRVI
jgi:hypothetical protein